MVIMNEAKQVIKEMTCSMENDEYIEFMRELSDWAGCRPIWRNLFPTMNRRTIKRYLITD